MNERDRIVKIMEAEGMNAKQFSQEVGVSAGTISNILGGRNKPSLEVMQAILRRFRSVNCLWLIMGAGNMRDGDSGTDSPHLLFPVETDAAEPADTLPAASAKVAHSNAPASPRAIQKILIFYTDGTFEER